MIPEDGLKRYTKQKRAHQRAGTARQLLKFEPRKVTGPYWRARPPKGELLSQSQFRQRRFGCLHLSCYPAVQFPPKTETGGRPALIELRPESPEELRKRLQEMSDLELRRFGQRARKLSDPKMNFGATEPHVKELEEARAEWRRRHPASPAGRNTRLPHL
jgi:hypothetical protein